MQLVKVGRISWLFRSMHRKITKRLLLTKRTVNGNIVSVTSDIERGSPEQENGIEKPSEVLTDIGWFFVIQMREYLRKTPCVWAF